MSSVDTTELETLVCPDGCGLEVTGKKKGPGSAVWKMGAHRARIHKIAGTGDKSHRKQRSRLDESELAAQPVALSVVRDALEEVNHNNRSAPSVDELTRAIGRGLQTVSVAVATITVETDRALSLYPVDKREAIKDQTVSHLSLSTNEAKEVAYPIGRAIGNSKVNKKVGRAVVDNVDLASSVSVLATMAVRYKQYLNMRAEAYSRAGFTAAPADGNGTPAPAHTPQQATPAGAGPYVPPIQGPQIRLPDGEIRKVGYDDLH